MLMCWAPACRGTMPAAVPDGHSRLSSATGALDTHWLAGVPVQVQKQPAGGGAAIHQVRAPATWPYTRLGAWQDAHVCAEDSSAVPPAGSMLVPPSSLPMVSGWALCECAARNQCSFLPVSCCAGQHACCCAGCRCIIDKVPRQLSAESCALLCNFAEMVVREIERDKVQPVLHAAGHLLHNFHPTHCGGATVPAAACRSQLLCS